MKTLLALVSVSVLALNISTLQTQAADGATVIKEFGCSILSEDSELPIDLFTDDTTHVVITPSGNSLLGSHFDIP